MFLSFFFPKDAFSSFTIQLPGRERLNADWPTHPARAILTKRGSIGVISECSWASHRAKKLSCISEQTYGFLYRLWRLQSLRSWGLFESLVFQVTGRYWGQPWYAVGPYDYWSQVVQSSAELSKPHKHLCMQEKTTQLTRNNKEQQ